MVEMVKNVLYGAKIIGTGKADLGEDTIVTNKKLAQDLLARGEEACKILGVEELPPDLKEALVTSDEWIQERTGVKQRHIVGKEWATSNLAISAGLNALKDADIRPDQIGSLRLATVFPDHLASPPTVSLVAYGMGIPVWDVHDYQLHQLIATDQSYACSTFLVALMDAYKDLAMGFCDYALVIGADKMSSIANQYDRGLLIILADHGSALVLKRVSFEQSDFRRDWLYSGGDGSKADRIITPVGGSRQPLTPEIVKKDPLLTSMKLRMDGKKVFEELVVLLKSHIIPEALEKAGLDPIDIAAVFFHQANIRMIKPVEKHLPKIGFRRDVVVFNTIDRYANTTCASIPLGIHDARSEGKLKKDDIVMLVAMGGGYSWIVVFIRWSL